MLYKSISYTTLLISGEDDWLYSRFALVLTGTPLENRLEELYTIATFVDEHRLGPAFRFLNRHRQTDDKGHVLGCAIQGDYSVREYLTKGRPLYILYGSF